jgi:hypothetical protein
MGCYRIRMRTLLGNLAGHLRSGPRSLPGVVVGFDGFVDEMISVVAERRSLDDFTPVPDIAAFGAMLARAAGHSSLWEMVVTARHPGGCAINLGDGLAALGVSVDAFATLGEPVHPAFSDIVARFRSCRSWGREPGRTLAFEFRDGKVMFSAVRQLADFAPPVVEKLLADGRYAAACAGAGLIALTNWTLYPHMTAVWELLQDQIFSRLSQRPAFFIDLVDPSSRAQADVRAMMDALPGFERSGPVTLSLNVNEANVLARALGLCRAGDDQQQALALAGALRACLGLSEVVIHRPQFAVAAAASEQAALASAFCAHPKKSTGAGDRFNAGFVLGRLLGLEAASRLALGCATAGFFVRQARSATWVELADFVERNYLAPDHG